MSSRIDCLILMIRQLPDARPSACERDALQPNPEVVRANLRASRDQSGGLFDRSDTLCAVVGARWKICAGIKRARAHVSALRRRTTLRRDLLFALAHRTTRTTRSARWF